MLSQLFSNTVYVRVSTNRFHLKHLESANELELDANPPFATVRLLVGQFLPASELLKAGLKKVANSRFFSAAPRVLMHPQEMIEGGLSQVEDRVLRELAMGAGASKVAVWIGPLLRDDEVTKKLDAK